MTDDFRNSLARPLFRLAALVISAFVIYGLVQLSPMLSTEWWPMAILLAVAVFPLLSQMLRIALTGRAFRFPVFNAGRKLDGDAAKNPSSKPQL